MSDVDMGFYYFRAYLSSKRYKDKHAQWYLYLSKCFFVDALIYFKLRKRKHVDFDSDLPF